MNLCICSLNRLGKNNNVRLIWIPSHQDFAEGNNYVDDLAREAALVPIPMDVEPVLPISTSFRKQILRKMVEGWWANDWQRGEGLAHARMVLVEPDGGRARLLQRLPRAHVRLLVGICTGHFFTNRMLCLMGKRENMQCENCSCDCEDMRHILCVCVKYEQARLEVFGSRTLRFDELRGASYHDLLLFARLCKRFDDIK